MQNRSAWIALLVGALLLLISNGKWNMPVAAWLSPIFFLLFIRAQRPLAGALIVTLVCCTVFAIAWQGLVPAPPLAYYGIATGFGIALALPFIVDRLFSTRLPAFTASLVFPVALVAVEFLLARVSPYTTWGSLAYTQTSPALLQLVSITGTAGLTFLMGWCAAGLAALVSARKMATLPTAVAPLALLVLALAFGRYRLNTSNGSPTKVRVAMIQRDWGKDSRAWRVPGRVMTPAGLDSIRFVTRDAHATLLAVTRSAATAGANVIVWSELAALVLRDDVPALIDSARTIAREHSSYIAVALGVFTPGARAMANEVVVLSPTGDIVATYHKGRPVPGDNETGGDTAPVTFPTPYGKIALAICFDLDFPNYVRAVGASRADLLLAPARDWQAIGYMHSHMAAFRAIENGVPLARATARGTSIATDAFGRATLVSSAFDSPPPLVIAEMSSGGVRTTYARFGDWFAWTCVAGLIPLVAAARRARPAA